MELSPHQKLLNFIWEAHLTHEFKPDAKSTEKTMDTMSNDPPPTVNHVPTLIGGVGKKELSHFYQNHFIFTNPDMELTPISRTIGTNTLVDEMIIKLTHSSRVDWLIPGIAPTNKIIEFPLVVIVGFAEENGSWKVSNERIYWDQATILVQLGLVDSTHLPVTGAEQAAKVKDVNAVPTNALLERTGLYHYKE